MSNIERRAFHVELRAVQSDGERRIIGHAAVFNALSEDLGGFRERIAPGAFLQSIEGDDVRALFNHSPDVVLGRTRSGTLRLSEDERGLLTEIDPPDTTAARDLIVSIDRGDIDQMSFGFRVRAGGQEWAEDGDEVIRTLTDVELFDVSPVTFPAYPQTDVDVRSFDEYRRTRKQRDDERAASVHAAARLRRLHLLQL